MRALRLALAPGGLARPPSWYLTMRAARYLGVAPWELMDAPAFWRHAALQAERAENMSAKQAAR